MKPIDCLRFLPGTIFIVGSVIGWLLGRPDCKDWAMIGIGCYLFAFNTTE